MFDDDDGSGSNNDNDNDYNNDNDNNNENDSGNSSGNNSYDSEVCYIAHDCADGFEKQVGRGGLLRWKDHPYLPGLPKTLDGAAFNDSYNWFHPNICCGKKVPKEDSQMYGMCKQGKVLSGHILNGDEDPYGQGGAKLDNSPYSWRHPSLCDAKDSKCVFAEKECPTGFTKKGNAGIIMPKENTFGIKGGEFANDYWYWNHPVLCCKNEE